MRKKVTLDPRHGFLVWFRSVTKVKITDISACSGINFTSRGVQIASYPISRIRFRPDFLSAIDYEQSLFPLKYNRGKRTSERARIRLPRWRNRLPATLKSEQRAYRTASVSRLDKRVSRFSRSLRFPCLLV